jgi:hypothetical protein
MPIKTFTEHVDAAKCAQVLQLNKPEIRKIFFEHNSDKNWETYWNRFSKYLQLCIKKQGVVKHTYHYANGATSGRWYVEKCGLQYLQGKLRRFVAGELYYDIDLINCHPRIFLHLCNVHGVQFSRLEEYVEDRQKIMHENNLTKMDVHVAMNTDKNKKRHNNEWYNCFIFELEQARERLLPKLDSTKVSPESNHKNPVSSQISKHLQVVEEEIIAVAIEYFGDDAEVPMFDGIMVNKNFCEEACIGEHIQNLNSLLEERYNGLAEFTRKSMDSDIDLNDLTTSNVPEEYEVVKQRFEEKFFHTLQPYTFWMQYTDAEGLVKYTQLNTVDFKTACREYRIIDYRPSGTLIMPPPSIYDKWIEDQNRRKYQCVDFIPYGHHDACPPTVYNTFDGFRINIVKAPNEGSSSEVSIQNFHRLIWNLCNEEVDTSDYLMKYIAHMFQYPDRMTEKIIVLRSWTGCGKDTLHRILTELMGDKYVGITGDPDQLFGNFNEICDSKICIFLNELEGKDGIAYQEKMKHYASAKKVRINAKYNKPMEQNNYARLFINSNQDGCVNLQVHDRRFVIINSGFKLVQNTSNKQQSRALRKFWDRMYNDMKDYHWMRAVYEHLMSLDLSNWSPKQTPQSKHHDLLRERNINPLHDYLRYIIDKGDYSQYLEKNINGKTVHMTKWKPWFTDYLRWVERNTDIEYTIKANATKVKLATMNKAWEPPRKCRVNGIMTFMVTFDFTAMKEFLDNYVYKDGDKPEDVLDLGEDCSQPKAHDSSFGDELFDE